MPLCLYTDLLIYQTAYIGPEKSKSQLRISEKKFGRKKMPRLARQNFPLSETWQKNVKKIGQAFSNFLTRFADGFQEPSSIL
jgi:hypothetical protein